MFEKLIATFVGKKIIKSLNLQEGTAMDTKKPWQSKAVWSAVLMAIIGAIQPISMALGHPISVPNWIIELLIGMGIYGVRTGDKPIA